MQRPIRILRRLEVQNRTGLARSTLYAFMASGRFPPSVRLGGRAVGWIEQEVEAWIEQRIEERDAGRRSS